jgi:hypothetical protein
MAKSSRFARTFRENYRYDKADRERPGVQFQTSVGLVRLHTSAIFKRGRKS